jgi:serine/threonine-protein kinase
MSDATHDALLDEVLDSWQRGREPDPLELAARHHLPAADIERAILAAARYRRATQSLRPDPPCSLRPGERLKDFEIVRFIGRGGMGEVYRARQLSLGGREVALKVLPVLLQTEAGRTRFRRECELLSNLHHPSLAEVHGFGEERGLSFFAMRLIDGRDLRSVLESLRTSRTAPRGLERQRRIVRWIAEVAEGLAVVHEARLVHRDVKPSNVIVSYGARGEDLPTGRAVLVDFGLVRAVEIDTASRTEGSPATLDYASPEQLMSAEVDSRRGRGPRSRPRAARSAAR